MEHRIKEAKGTILIYKGEPICYNILNTFAEQLGEALQRLGEEVEYFDVKQSGEAALAAYAGKTYQAVIGFQSYLFDIYLPKAGVYLHDLIKGPKINFQFDHPIWMKNHYIGTRHGEKKYETLLTREECMHAFDLGNFYRVPADNRDLNYEQYYEKGQVEKAKLEEFTSDNTTILNVEQVKEKLLSLEYVRNELENM